MAGEKLCIQVWQSIDKLGTGLLGPLQARRMGKVLADVRRQDALIDAQTKGDVENILSGKASVDANGKLIGAPDRSVPTRVEPIPPALSYDPEKMNTFVQNREQAKATLRYLNLRGTVRFVEEELVEQAKLQGEEKVPEEPPKVDQDWLFRWASAAEQVSNEDMQRLWAPVLAGESQRPGSFSLWTLEALRTLSKPEAELIQKAATLVLNGSFIFREASVTPRYLTFGELLYLQELGIVVGVEAIGGQNLNTTRQDSGMYAAVIVSHDKAAIVVQVPTATPIPVNCYGLSGAGRGLMQLGHHTCNLEYLFGVGRHIRSSVRDVKVNWALVRPAGDGGSYFIEKVFALPEETVKPDVPQG